MRSRVIVFNGVGSVGKTSICRALQNLAAAPILHVKGDTFIGMIDPRLYDHPSGYTVTHQRVDEQPMLDIVIGPAIQRVMKGMRAAVGALAQAGNDCLVDDMMLSACDQASYVASCGGARLQFVGLHAPLHVVEARECSRGDRILGLARWQFDRVHRDISYDVEISTKDKSPTECAIEIANALDLPRSIKLPVA